MPCGKCHPKWARLTSQASRGRQSWKHMNPNNPFPRSARCFKRSDLDDATELGCWLGGCCGTWEPLFGKNVPRDMGLRCVGGLAPLPHRPLSLPDRKAGDEEDEWQMTGRDCQEIAREALPIQWLAPGGYSSLGSGRATRCCHWPLHLSPPCHPPSCACPTSTPSSWTQLPSTAGQISPSRRESSGFCCSVLCTTEAFVSNPHKTLPFPRLVFISKDKRGIVAFPSPLPTLHEALVGPGRSVFAVNPPVAPPSVPPSPQQ
jgi:hypothetical protein